MRDPDIYDDLPGEGPVPKTKDESWKVEPYTRTDVTLECEHRDVLDDRSLDPCHNDAVWVVTVPFENAETRTRYCDEHIEGCFESWLTNRREYVTESDE